MDTLDEIFVIKQQLVEIGGDDGQFIDSFYDTPNQLGELSRLK